MYLKVRHIFELEREVELRPLRTFIVNPVSQTDENNLNAGFEAILCL